MICLSFSSAPDGVYYLKSNESSEIHPVYCQISSLSAKCGEGGWTLVMKLDKNKVDKTWHTKYKFVFSPDSLENYCTYLNACD